MNERDQLYALLLRQAGLDGTSAQGGGKPLVPEAPGGPAPLSLAQRRLWFLQLLEGIGIQYNNGFGLRLTGALDIARLERALSALIERHEALRTVFKPSGGEGGEPVQCVCAAEPVRLAARQVRDEAEALNLAEELAARPFDLAADRPVRFHLLRLSREVHLLVGAIHHVCSDGWSLAVLLDELGRVYRGEALEPLPVQYSDYAVWEQSQVERRAGSVAYWTRKLQGAPSRLELPFDRPRPERQRYAGAHLDVTLSPDLARRLTDLAAGESTTLQMSLLAGFSALLACYTEQDDMVLGLPTANRPRPEFEGLIGFFTNTIPLRLRCASEATFREHLRRVTAECLEGLRHADAPFEAVVEALSPERSLRHAPVFQTMFAFQSLPPRPPHLPGLICQYVRVNPPASPYDLFLSLEQDEEGGVSGRLVYDSDLFEPVSASRLAENLGSFLETAVHSPEVPLGRLDWLAPAQRELVLHRWQGRAGQGDERSTLATLLAKRVERDAGKTALIPADGEPLSLRSVWEQARDMAWTLASAGLRPEEPVALLLPRSVDLVVSMAAALLAGSPWLCLDPVLPQRRIEFMIRDAKVRHVLTTPEWAERVALTGVHPLFMGRSEAAPGGFIPPGLDLTPDSAAYILYTSGSTGRPKGVVGLHRGMVCRLQWGWHRFPYRDDERCCLKTAPSFADWIAEVMSPLLSAVPAAVLADEDVRDPERLLARLAERRATRFLLVPSLLSALLEQAPDLGRRLERLWHWTVSGEPLRGDLLARFRKSAPGATLVNLYGTSEVSADVTCEVFAPADAGGTELAGAAIAPIGRPLPGARVFVLDKLLHPVPPGVPGTLFVAGPYLARGYLDQPEATAASFVPLAFRNGEEDTEPVGRMFRTGDRGRFRWDGCLEYLGRNDFVITLHGLRIDPGEVEAHLRDHPAVRQAAVKQHEPVPGQGQLVAFLELRAGSDAVPVPTAEEIRSYLSERLPPTMIPHRYLRLDRLPLLPSGKLDRQGLPSPDEAQSLPAGSECSVPRTPAEVLIVEQWTAVLGRPPRGMDEQFFAAGGHSLMAMRLSAHIAEAAAVAFPVHLIFQWPTVAGMAKALTAAIEALTAARQAGPDAGPCLGGDGPPLEVLDRGEHPPISPAQRRFWILNRMDRTGGYVMAGALRLSGPANDAALARTLGWIVERHLPLRTVYGSRSGRPWLTVRPAGELDFRIEEIEARSGTDRATVCRDRLAALARTQFDLDAAPPFKVRLLRIDAGERYLVLVMHHILIDGWSSQLLFQELAEGYRAFAAGREPETPDPAPSYFDAAAWLQARQDCGAQDLSLAYWRELLADAAPAPQMPTDRPRPAVRDGRGATFRFSVSADVARGMRKLTAACGTTEYCGLLAAFALLLARHSEASDLVLGIISANRPHRDLHGIIGLFANTLPLRLRLDQAHTGADLLALVDRAVRDATRHEEPPFERIVEHNTQPRDLSRTPLFQTLFVYQNDPFRAGLEGLAVEALPLDGDSAPYDLTFELQPLPDGGYLGAATYATCLWDEASIARLAGHFTHLCRFLASGTEPERGWRDYPLAGPEERAAVLKLSHGELPAAPAKPIPELITEWAHRDPDRPAVAGPLGGLSRGELCRLASGVAQQIQAAGSQDGAPDQLLVALCLEAGPDYVAAWLGVMLAGAAVLPLDPSWPTARLQMVLDRVRPTVLIGTASLRGDLRLTAGTLSLDMRDLAPRDIPAAVLTKNDALAYVVFTSGSTGEPKGVAVEHAALGNLARAQRERYDISESTRTLLAVSPAFDVAMGELATVLSAGGTVVTAPRESLVPSRDLAELLKRERITYLSMAASALAAMPSDAAGRLGSLSTLVSGGEVLPSAVAARWARGRRLFNAYGPSEATVCALAGEYSGPNVLGRPLAGVQALVLDEHGNVQPFGVPGELCLAGRGLARGYLGRPDLTEAAFRRHDQAVGGRLYHTGDRAWLSEDGAFHFLGRRDAQVKVRGIRVEPAETLACLELQPGVSRAAVLPREVGGEMRLVAYVAAQETVTDEARWLDGLRDRLRELLPDALLPARLLRVPAMPLTPNGKVDVAALPVPEDEPPAREHAARCDSGSPIRKVIAEVWCEVLGHETSSDVNFFDAGGHSLRLAQVQALIEERLQRRVSMVDLFRHPTIASLAKWLETEDPRAFRGARSVGTGTRSGDIAVIGMACRYPEAPDLAAYWDVIREGRETLRTFTREELLAAGVTRAILDDPDFVPVQGFVEDIECFDAAFFGISPTDADLLDPQQRVFLECAYHALEHAGYAPGEDPQQIAVFAGSGTNEYLRHLFPDGPAFSAEGFNAATGNDKDFLASRTAYLLNLTGPAVSVQTACSTSLVAVALACQTLRQGRARMALAGGVSLLLRPRGYLAREGLIFSKDGHCRTFDAQASGTVPGGGCGVVALRPLEDAVDARDVIYAVIRGTALNNDGSAKAGYTAPGVDGQTEVICAALADAGVEPATIGYVETHGTGTRLGDPIEVSALNRAYGLAPREAVITLGSVKANMGHADAAAGIAGLIKAALCLWHETLPPTPHFGSPNPEIDFTATPFRVCTLSEPWKRGEHPRRAGVSSFGIGGTNAHMILEERDHDEPRHVAPPSYPFARERHWRESARPAPAGRRGDPQTWFYVPVWRRAAAPAPVTDGVNPGRWLILAEGGDGADRPCLGKALAAEVERNGGSATLVLPGTRYERADDLYRVRPHSRNDFETLLADLKARGRDPQTAAHLWSMDALDEPDRLEAPGGGLDMACFSFLWLARAMGLDAVSRRMLLVTGGLFPIQGTEQGPVLASLALGAARVIPHEQENLTVRVVDVDEKAAGLGVEGLADLSERLLREAMFGREPEVGLRGRVRYAPGVAPQPLPPCRSGAVGTEASSLSVRPEPATGPSGPDLLPFGRGGFWWITGGLGGVGLALASGLAVDRGVKLLLTSRSGLPPREHWSALSRETNERGRRIRLVRELEEQGAEILVLAADAADRVRMEQALAAAKEQFGFLGGVIHAAGLADEGGVLRRRTREETLPVLAPKVAGSLLLRGIARREQAPLVLCSSLGNLLPATKFAQTGYAAANEFLDLLADRESEARILTINWDDWSEAGMSARAAENWRARHHLGTAGVVRLPGLSPDEGWEAFCRALASGLPRVAVSVRDLYQLMDDCDLSARGFAEQLATAHSRPDVGIAFETPLPGLEAELAAIWGEVLGMASVGAQDDFFELGGHSLLSTRLVTLVQQRLGLFLPINAIFDTPVLRDMAARLAAAVPPPEAAQTGPDEEMEEDVF